MRPEIKEYNYDWMMAGVMNMAGKVPNGTAKETALTYRYVPYFSKVARTFIESGEVGVQILNLFARYYGNVLGAHAAGKKIALTTFCFSPAILYAMDVVPICTEIFTALGGIVWRRGMFDYLDHACQIGLPETSCSSQRGAMGAYLAGLGESFDFVICDTPGVCDTNANAFAFAAAYLDKPFFQLNYPQNIGDHRTEGYHLEDYQAMVRFVEEQTGKKMDYERLAEVLAEVEKQDALIADLEDLHTLTPTPIPPLFNLALYAGKFTFSGNPEYTVLLEKMAATAKQLAAAGLSGLKTGREKLRACMFYIDHYTLNVNFWNWLSENGVAHMGSILSHHFRDNLDYAKALKGSAYGVDTSSPDAMLNSVAQMNARLPMVRSVRGPYDQPNMWLEETLVLAKHFGAECMIYNGTPGCRNTWANVKLIARDLERHGYPVHIMYDDAFDDRVESWEATRERLEEFFTIRGLL